MRGLGGVSAVKVRPREEERIAIEACCWVLTDNGTPQRKEERYCSGHD